MGWIDLLRGKVVGIDTNPFIYYIERNPRYLEILRAFFQAMNRNECVAVTSVVTLLETLVVPIRVGDASLVSEYQSILSEAEGLTTVSLLPGIAEEAARLRPFHNLRTPDAIQVATAIDAKASFFLTNDVKLSSLPDLKVVILDELLKSGTS